ncbi:unnamed protein product [Dibothriocephalus latus]|uniref:Uncharacterized protein n=1 Tax=Dibothriocephalus latus TaxID=60516 RepID=A0A3P7M6S0_DIBLA|nr:unnamed protein product [Dibothriocephalus latus]
MKSGLPMYFLSPRKTNLDDFMELRGDVLVIAMCYFFHLLSSRSVYLVFFQAKAEAEKAARDRELQLREEEELQLALALSASEAESKQKSVSRIISLSQLLLFGINDCLLKLEVTGGPVFAIKD